MMEIAVSLTLGEIFPKGKLGSSSHDLHGCGGDDPIPRNLTYVTKTGVWLKIVEDCWLQNSQQIHAFT